MESHEFDITIDGAGKVDIHVQGVKGPACEQYAELFQQILQGKTEVERTSDYYAPPTDVRIRIDQERQS